MYRTSGILLTLIAITVVTLAKNSYSQTCPGSPGCIDPTFGIGGTVVTSPPAALVTNNVARDMVIQADGKIVVLVGAKDLDNTFSGVLVRFTADGSIDAAFGNGGFAYLAWGTPNYCLPQKLAIQMVSGEQYFVVVGAGGCGVAPGVRVERFTQWGLRDSSFGNGGVTTINAVWNPQDYSIAIQSDQKILLAGGANPMVRLKANGTADTSFGPNGISKTNSGIRIKELQVLSNGKFVAGGYASNGANNDFAAVRFNSNGSLDKTFGSRGKTLVDFGGGNDIVLGIAVDASGKMLLAGHAAYPNSTPAGAGFDAAMIRLKSDGKIDTTFGTGGRVLRLNNDESTDYFSSVSVQSNGKIVLAGQRSLPIDPNNSEILTARYKSNGTLDTTFQLNGWNTTDIYGSTDSVAKGRLRIDPSCSCEKFVIAGHTLTEPYTGLYMNPRYLFGIRFML
ncbi:MAG: hypothetical protein IPM25_14420 [Chloracidobacterium sp.]|nr:hypothetical protein [Chloracidobacterium sp.]